MEQLLSILTWIRPECDFISCDDFVEQGLLDSLDIITLVAELEDKLGVCIEGADIIPENFRNLKALGEFVGRCKGTP
jgi:acyl carrier protein